MTPEARKTEFTILIVDDDTSILFVLKHLFEHKGFLVFTAENGIEAIAKLKITRNQRTMEDKDNVVVIRKSELEQMVAEIQAARKLRDALSGNMIAPVNGVVELLADYDKVRSGE